MFEEINGELYSLFQVAVVSKEIVFQISSAILVNFSLMSSNLILSFTALFPQAISTPSKKKPSLIPRTTQLQSNGN